MIHLDLCTENIIIEPYEDAHLCGRKKGHKGDHMEKGIDESGKKYELRWRYV